jgi:hypothetical protein
MFRIVIVENAIYKYVTYGIKIFNHCLCAINCCVDFAIRDRHIVNTLCFKVN